MAEDYSDINAVICDADSVVVPIHIPSLPGCADIDVLAVNYPAFLDHALDAKAVRTSKFRSEQELVEHLRGYRSIYILACYRYRHGGQDVYLLRSAPGPKGLAGLAVDITCADRCTLDQDTFMPYRQVTMRMRPERIMDLTSAWGRAEAARQIGEQVLRALDTTPLTPPAVVAPAR